MSNETNPNFLRRIRSFVKREGRLTPGQDSAIKTGWPFLLSQTRCLVTTIL